MRIGNRFLILAFVFLCCLSGFSPAQASILTYNTFGENHTYQQGGGTSWLIGSIAGLDNQQSIAAIFTPTFTLPLHSLRLPTSFQSGENSFIGSIVQADTNFLPNGPVLETFTNVQFTDFPNDGIITLTSATNALLSNGRFYFLVLQATNPSSSVGGWHQSPGFSAVYFRNRFNGQV